MLEYGYNYMCSIFGENLYLKIKKNKKGNYILLSYIYLPKKQETKMVGV